MPDPINLTPPSDTVIKNSTKEEESPIKKRKIELSGEAKKQGYRSHKIENLVLTAADRKKVNLTTQKLNEWLAIAEPTKNLSRYGFKSLDDFIKFLNSPAGQTVRRIISDKKLAKMIMRNLQRQKMSDMETRKHRRVAALLLALSYRKNARAKNRDEAILAQIEKTLHGLHKAASEDKKPDIDNLTNNWREARDAYQSSLQDFDKALAELSALEEQENTIDQRYDTLGHHLTQTDNYLDKAMGEELKHDDITNAIEQRIVHLQNEINSKELSISKQAQLRTQLDSLTKRHESGLGVKITNGDRIAYIENKVDQLEKEINEKLAQFDTLLRENKDEEAMRLTAEIQGLYTQVGSMQDAIDVLNEEKIMYDADGKKIDSLKDFKDAHFFLSKEQKIVKDNGKYYLLGPSQSLDTMNEEERAGAQQNYERARPNIASLKNLIEYNKGVETSLHQEKRNAAEQRHTDLREQITLLNNQRNTLQAANANITTYAADTARPTIAPTPTSMSTSIRLSSSPMTSLKTKPSPTPRLIKALEMMQAKPTKDSIQRLDENLRGVGMPKGDRNDIRNQIIPGRRIPEQTMRNLVAALDRFAVSVINKSRALAKQHAHPDDEVAKQQHAQLNEFTKQHTQQHNEPLKQQETQQKNQQQKTQQQENQQQENQQEAQQQETEERKPRTPLSTIPEP